MQGFSIVFFAAYAMVRDPGVTFRLAVLPWAVAMATGFVLFQLMTGQGFTGFRPERAGQWGYLAALSFSLFVICTIGAWVGMSWHRHILLKEGPVAVLPRRNAGLFHDYFDAVMKFGLLLLVIVLMIRFLTVPMVPAMGLGGPGGHIVSLGISALLISLVLRHGLILPAAAVGRPISMDRSWQATQGYSGPIYLAAFVIVLVVDLAGELPDANPAALALQAAAAWAALILSFGVLAVIYGVRIEGRRMIV